MHNLKIKLDEVGLDYLFSIEKLKHFDILNKSKAYTGRFLVINGYLIPFMKLPFLKEENATLDLSAPGQLPGILYNQFNFLPHIHYEPHGFPVSIKRTGLIGKLY